MGKPEVSVGNRLSFACLFNKYRSDLLVHGYDKVGFIRVRPEFLTKIGDLKQNTKKLLIFHHLGSPTVPYAASPPAPGSPGPGSQPNCADRDTSTPRHAAQ